MTGPYDVDVVHAEVSFIAWERARAMRLSSGWIRDALEARARVVVRYAGHEVTGMSSTSVSDRWAWPGSEEEHEERQEAMCTFMTSLAADLPALCDPPAHPLELGLRLHEHAGRTSAPLSPPPLARSVCVSPFDAAVHDAVGIAVGKSAFDLYPPGVVVPSADALLGGDAAGAVRAMQRPAVRTLDAWWIVGRDDTDDELHAAVAQGYRCLKLKLLGDPRDDAAFTRHVHDVASRASTGPPRLSVDYNGGADSPAQVLVYLDHLDGDAARDALAYVEQPTPPDRIHGDEDYGPVSERLPVVVDEALTGLDVLPRVRAQRWSGIALKTARGHSLCVVAGAWAVRNGLTVAFQDLTNPGYAAIHAALFAARVHSVNGIELNSPQFTPAANQEWLPRLSGLFEPKDGRHVVPGDCPGLGSTA